MVIKQSVVDVLMFIFERYLGDDNEIIDERELMLGRLEEMGFHNSEINQAFDWLEDLAVMQDAGHAIPLQAESVRIFSKQETSLLNEIGQGFVLYLEDAEILTPVTRELVLDRVVALGQELDIDQLKWIVMIVLHTHPGEETAFAWMESLVFDEVVDYMH